MAKSDRISVQVVGQSTLGRDLYLVTLTAPEDTDETARQTAWKNQIKNDPTAAAKDATLQAQYKTPVWISNNIHGNEWEGTDAAMQYIEYLATAPLSEVGSILRNNRLYFSPSLNPDGRTAATRATSLGLDPNRDMITNATAETKSYVRSVQAIQPIYTADFHGYTGVLQIEPCGPPHGTNYEYDLSIPHNYALALKVEKDVVAAAIPGNPLTSVGGIAIPYRDDQEGGWDDFPPVFSAQYSAFFGAATSTVELPLSRQGAGGTQTPERAKVNTAVALQTMKSIVGYMNDPTAAKEMLSNQIETFRRAQSEEPKKQLTVADVNTVPGPTQWRPLWDALDDQEPLVLPNAYVIPRGAGQRSESDAAALVKQLVFHGIEVDKLTSATTVEGKTYPAGSYVVDLDQPMRGLANSLLDLGDDISDNVPQLYADGAWSYSYLWGATVDKVGVVTDGPIGASTPVTAPSSNFSAPATPAYTTFDVAGVADFTALNALLEEGVPVSMLKDGSAVVGSASASKAEQVAKTYDIDLEPATEADLDALDDADTKPLRDLKVAYVGTADDRIALTTLGFDDLTQVTVTGETTGIQNNPSLLDGVDVLWIGSTFATSSAPVARAAVQALLDRGGALTGRGAAAFNAAKDYGLMTGNALTSANSATALVSVDTPKGSVLEPYRQDTAYIYPATWFTELGAGTNVQQRYSSKPLLAGHWRPSVPAGSPAGTVPTNGPAYAANNASVVSSETQRPVVGVKTRSIVFGTSVFFRTNPKSLFSEAARGIFWAAPAAGSRLVAPTAGTTSPAQPSTPTQTTSPTQTTTQSTATAPAVKAPSSLDLSAKVKRAKGKGAKKTVKLSIALSAAGLTPGSTVTLTKGGKTLAVVQVAADGTAVVKVKLRKGRQTLVATYAGSTTIAGSSDTVRLRVR
nr:M14 family zinc carboxypeptidase [Nocardioides flavescens]